jgi:glycosyltransferase involved in cell wall biosynthesis
MPGNRIRPKHKRSRAHPSIAAALIVRDEARCITRCLESVRPYVDRMLVLDTGSTDGTPELAAACGAEVHHLEWPNDFAAARNHALDLADADWNLVIDADEWIVSGGERLRRSCRGPARLGLLCVHSAIEGHAAPGAGRRNWMGRLLPRGVRYAGRVHEQPVSSLSCERIELHIAHDGYLEDQVARKRDRNGPLLARDLLDRPGNPYILYQLGKDTEHRGELAAANAHYAAAYLGVSPTASWRHALVLRRVNCLRKAGQLDRALALAESEMPNWPDSPDFFYMMGNLAFDRAAADPARAGSHWLPLAASALERCLAIGERPDLEGSLHGCGSHLARHNLEVARTQMALHEARQELARLCA